MSKAMTGFYDAQLDNIERQIGWTVERVKRIEMMVSKVFGMFGCDVRVRKVEVLKRALGYRSRSFRREGSVK